MYAFIISLGPFIIKDAAVHNQTHTINQMRIQYKDAASVALLANKAAARRGSHVFTDKTEHRTTNTRNTNRLGFNHHDNGFAKFQCPSNFFLAERTTQDTVGKEQ